MQISALDLIVSGTFHPQARSERMKGFTGRAKLKQIAKLYGPFATALLFGAFIKIYLRSLADLPNELADALIIAGLIGLAIEIWSKQVLIDDVADILSERLVGYRLPRKAQAVIGNLVLKSKIVLRDYCATFQFTLHPSKSGYLMVRMVISYKALNNGMEPTKYPCGMSEELIYKPTLESLRHGSQTYSGNAISPLIPLPNAVETDETDLAAKRSKRWAR